jgi:hypothetical protein
LPCARAHCRGVRERLECRTVIPPEGERNLSAKLRIALGLLIGATGAVAEPQSLAEAARREQERRGKQGTPAARPITEEDLQKTGQGNGTVSNPGGYAPAAASEPASSVLGSYGSSSASSSSSASAGGGSVETHWRDQAAQRRAAVTTAEARLKRLEAEATRLGPRVPGSLSAPCQAGVALTGRRHDGPVRLRDASAGQTTCDGDALKARDIDRIHAEMAQTRVEIEKARRSLAELDDEARRAGAMPGWLR